MNQFFAGNLEIDYPFAARPIRNRELQTMFADAVFRLSPESEIFDAGRIQLTDIDVGFYHSYTFTIVGGPYNGWYFKCSNVSWEEFKRVPLTLFTNIGLGYPHLGYGYIVLGSYETPTTVNGLNHDMSDSTIRLMGTDPGFSLRLANAPCPGDTVPAGTPGTPTTIDYRGRSTATIPGCVEVGIYPAGDPNAGDPLPQVAVTPDEVGDSTTEVAVPAPAESVEVIEAGSVTTITLTPLSTTDALPPDPGYDVSVIGVGPIAAGPEVFAGHNAIIAGDIGEPAISFSFGLGRGDGYSCDPVPGCGVGVRASDALKSILGVHAETLEFVPGQGVDVLASPGDNRIYFVFNAQRLTSVAT